MGRQLAATLLMGVMLVMMLAVNALPAFAAPGPKASCIGIGSSSVGHAQTRDEASHDVKQLAEEKRTTQVAIFSCVAKQHLGSEEACFGEGE